MTKSKVIVDVESRSLIDLTARGFRAYASDESTQLVSLVALTDTECLVWVNSAVFPSLKLPSGRATIPPVYGNPGTIRVDYQESVPDWLMKLAETHIWVGHNAGGFDAPFCREKLSLDPEWIDTLPLSKMAGLPGKLDEIGKRLLNVGKHEGGKILSQFYDANKKAPAHLLWALINYNICDCLITRRLLKEIEQLIPDLERDLIRVHDEINTRGVGVDTWLIKTISDLTLHNINNAGSEIARLTFGALQPQDLRSVPKLKKWLASNGFHVENTRRETLTKLINDPDTYFMDDADVTDIHFDEVRPVIPRVLRLRSAAVRTTGAKLSRMLDRVDSDGRMRDLLVYYGAHTGRFSSRVVQLHNMNRGVPKADVPGMLKALKSAKTIPARYQIIVDEADRLAREHGMTWVGVDDLLGTLIRYVLIPTPGKRFGIVDYAAIESRGAAWIANEQNLLVAYRDGVDVYCDFGSTLFGKTITKKDEAERQVSKIVVLGSQYGLGAKKLAFFGANNNVDFHSVGVTPEQCIEAYRTKYANIPRVWYSLREAVFEAVDNPGVLTEAGKCRWCVVDSHLICQLPSGRELCYPNARIENVLMVWGEVAPAVTYDHHRGFRKQLWHGLITENVVQAICRDLLCGALLRISKSLPVVLHVHDEIVCELNDSNELKIMIDSMEQGEDWAVDFPIAVEGYVSLRYGKAKITS